MTTALLTAGIVGALVVLLAYALCRDSRRRDDAYDGWVDDLFSEELPRSDPHVIDLALGDRSTLR